MVWSARENCCALRLGRRAGLRGVSDPRLTRSRRFEGTPAGPRSHCLGFTAIVLLWLRYAERLPFSSIGFRLPTWKGIVFGIVAALVLTANSDPPVHRHRSSVSPEHGGDLARRQSIMSTPYWYRILLVLRAAFTEEVIYRGYLIEKVRQLSKSITAASSYPSRHSPTLILADEDPSS